MNLLCVLFDHKLKGQRSLYTSFICCERCDKRWDAEGRPMTPLFDRAELDRQIRRGVPVASATYVPGGGGKRLSRETVTDVWFLGSNFPWPAKFLGFVLDIAVRAWELGVARLFRKR